MNRLAALDLSSRVFFTTLQERKFEASERQFAWPGLMDKDCSATLIFLQLHNVCEELARIEVDISVPAALEFAEKVGKPLISKLKATISNRFSSHDVVAAFSIFDPRKVPAINSAEICTYGEASLDMFISYFGTQKFQKNFVRCGK